MAGGTDGTNLYKIAFSDADPGFLSRIPYLNFYSFRIPDPRSRISDPGFKIPDLGSRIQKQQQKRGLRKHLFSNLFFSVADP